jgi:hypothetical protein
MLAQDLEGSRYLFEPPCESSQACSQNRILGMVVSKANLGFESGRI